MPNPVPQSRIPNRNEGATQTQGKNAPKQASKKTQLLTAKSASPKDATKRIEHFDGNPTKKNTSGRQMPAGRREQMDREISLFVQAVFESFVRDAQSKGGNPAVCAANSHNCSKEGKALAAKSKSLEIDVGALQNSDSQKGTVMGTWSKPKHGSQCGHAQVPHDIAVHFTRLCALSEETSKAGPAAKGRAGKEGTALGSAPGIDSRKGSALLPAQGTGQARQTTATKGDAIAKAMKPRRPNTSANGGQR